MSGGVSGVGIYKRIFLTIGNNIKDYFRKLLNENGMYLMIDF